MSREDREGFKAAYEEMTGGQLELKWAAARTAKVSEIESVEAAVSGPKYPDVTKITLTIEETGQKVLADVRYNGTEFAYDYKFNYHTLPQVNAYANAWLEADGRYRMDYLPVGGRYVLVETRTPEGYVKAEPVAVKVEETVDVQLHDVFNERKHSGLVQGVLGNRGGASRGEAGSVPG